MMYFYKINFLHLKMSRSGPIISYRPPRPFANPPPLRRNISFFSYDVHEYSSVLEEMVICETKNTNHTN